MAASVVYLETRVNNTKGPYLSTLKQVRIYLPCAYLYFLIRELSGQNKILQSMIAEVDQKELTVPRSRSGVLMTKVP